METKYNLITYTTYKIVAHLSLLQWCCLGNRLCSSYIPSWGVLLHVVVGSKNLLDEENYQI